jgi:hypothetical protein
LILLHRAPSGEVADKLPDNLLIIRTHTSTPTALRARRRRQRALAGLALLCLLAHLPPLVETLLGAWPFPDDALGQFGPWREFARQSLARGELPLWNPHQFCGLPFMSNGQTALLYPPNLLYWLLPARLAMPLDALAHNVLLAWGAYALARALGLSRTASWLTAALLALSGAVSGHLYAGHITWHAARAYLPWEAWALLLYVRRGERRYAWLLAVLVALQIHSGSPPVVLLSAAWCLGLLVAWRLVGRRFPVGWPGTLLAAGALAASLAAVVLLPLREMGSFSMHVGGLTYQVAVTISGTWRTFARLLLPDFFGGNADLQWSAGLSEAPEEAASIGLPALLLALLAPWLVASKNFNFKFKIFALLGLLLLTAILALGQYTPVYGWLFAALPPLRLMRVPVRWLELWVFGAALLAGFSFDALHRAAAPEATAERRRIGRLLWPVLLVVAALCLVLALGVALTAPDAPLWTQTAQWNLRGDAGVSRWIIASQLRRAALLAALAGAVLCVLAAACCRSWQRAPTMPRRRRAERMLALVLVLDVLLGFWHSAKLVPPEQFQRLVAWPPALTSLYQAGQRWDTHLYAPAIGGGMTSGIDLFNGYDPLNGRRYFEFAGAMEGFAFWSASYQPVRRTPLLRVASVTHTLAMARDTTSHQMGEASLAAQAGEWQLWEREGAWPRLYLTRHLIALPAARQLPELSRLAAQPFEANARPVVIAPGAFARIANMPLTPGDAVLDWTRRTNAMTVWTQASAPSVLVQGEVWYPGWRAWVNGRPTALEPANFLFRGVAVPPGRAQVDVVYEPQTYRFALFLSLCGLAALGAMLTQRRFR